VAYPSGLVGQPGEFDNHTQGTPLLLPSHRPQLLVIAPQSFQRPNYYWWFKKLDRVLRNVGASYFNDPGGNCKLACHLDIVQDATAPVWGGLQRPVKERLIARDLPFLRLQLAQEPIHLVLLNGSGLVTAYGELLSSSPLLEVESLRFGRVRVFRGRGPAHLTVIGWNINLQTTPGVSNAEIDQIGEAVRRVAAE
jgi:hypothetical protein